MTRAVLRRWAVLVLAVALWEIIARRVADVFFPPPSAIVRRMYELWFSGPVHHAFLTDNAVGNVLPSLARMGIGLGAALVLGVLVGLALGRSARFYGYVDPVLQFARVIPPP